MSLQIERQQAKDNPSETFFLRGELDAKGGTALIGEVRKALPQLARHDGVLHLNFSGVTKADDIGAAALAETVAMIRARECTIQATGIAGALEQQLAQTPAPAAKPATRKIGTAELLGETTVKAVGSAKALLQLLADTVFWAVIAPLKGRFPPPGSITTQAVKIGADAVPIASVTAFLIGLSTAFQAAHQLRAFGANLYVANLVGVAMVYELGPLVTAIVVAGRSGSAIAAELGTMTVGEEIDALRIMGIDPVRFLVVPRLYAITVVQPALALLATAAGILGGFVIAIIYLDLSPQVYLNQTISALNLRYLTVGLAKSIAFAWVIAITGSHCGLRIRGGAVGVGRATTAAVVASIFAIIFVDSIMTTVDTTLGP